MTGRMGRSNTWGPRGTRERTSASNWAKPHRWNRLAAEGLLPDGTPNVDGHRPRVFCASLADVFEDRPEVAPWRSDLFDLIAQTPNLDWLVLTKRPDLAASWLQAWYAQGIVRGPAGLLDDQQWSYRDGSDWGVLPNLWVGTSIESTGYTWRADELRRIPAVVRFISAEPLLGSLFDVPPGRGSQGHSPSAALPAERDGRATPSVESLSDGMSSSQSRPLVESVPAGKTVGDDALGEGPGRARRAPLDLTGIDWVIIGGESGGRNARPMHPDWARQIRDAVIAEPCGRCEAGESVSEFHFARPALHFKQFGSYDAEGVYRGANPKSAGKLLDGVEWCEFPTPAAPLVPA